MNLKKISKTTFLAAFFILAIMANFQLFSLQTQALDCEHQFTDWSVNYRATCSRTGLQSRTCYLCGEKEEQVIEKTDHLYSNWVQTVAPTCVTAGQQTSYCIYCMTQTTQSIAATGHSFNDFYTYDIEPTYLYEGSMSKHCANCSVLTSTTIVPVLQVGVSEELYAVSSTSSTINLEWKAVDDAAGYIIYKHDGSWKTIGTVSASTLNFQVTGLDSSTTYKLKVKAFVIEDSTTIYGTSIATYESRTSPAKATITSNSETDTAIRINWLSLGDIDGYEITIYQDGKRLKTVYTDADTLTYRFSGLYTRNEYSFVVRGYEVFDGRTLYGEYSDTYYATTDPIELEMDSYTSTGESITLNWVTEYNAAGYRVYQKIDGTYTKITTISGGSVSEYTVKNLSSSTTYYFKVKAYFKTSEGTRWGLASEAFVALTSPAQVTLTTFTNTTTAIRINWNEVSSATGYRVYIYKSGSWVLLSDITDSSVTTYRCSGLTINTTYIFKVQAYLEKDSRTFYGESSSVYVAFTDPS